MKGTQKCRIDFNVNNSQEDAEQTQGKNSWRERKQRRKCNTKTRIHGERVIPVEGMINGSGLKVVIEEKYSGVLIKDVWTGLNG